MTSIAQDIRAQLARQVAHWTAAAQRLGDLNDLAAPAAWKALEDYLHLSLRQHLAGVVESLNRQAALLEPALNAAESLDDLQAVRRKLLAFRGQFLRAETTLDFFADAINTRTSERMAAMLRACDILAHRSMAQVLEPLGRETPVVLTYLDKGLGASILKAGLRLWDGGIENPVAAIKITRHNLYRPTSLIHEAGHQVAHILGWNGELADALAKGLARNHPGVADLWASWASEIAADAFAFAHTGYASVAALHDVLAGDAQSVFRHRSGDPHPISYLRILLGVQMCHEFYGEGPWDSMARAWEAQYPVERASNHGLIREAKLAASQVINTTLRQPFRAFHQRSLSLVIDPSEVSPPRLAAMQQRFGEALYTSARSLWTNTLRLLALSGLPSGHPAAHGIPRTASSQCWLMKLGAPA